MRNVADKCCRENQKTQLCSETFFQNLCCLSDNMEKYGRTILDIGDNIIGHMPFACWLTKARNAHP